MGVEVAGVLLVPPGICRSDQDSDPSGSPTDIVSIAIIVIIIYAALMDSPRLYNLFDWFSPLIKEWRLSLEESISNDALSLSLVLISSMLFPGSTRLSTDAMSVPVNRLSSALSLNLK